MKLAHQTNHPFTNHAIIDQPDSTGTVDHQRNDGLGKDDIGPQGKQRNSARLQGLAVVPLGENDELTRLDR
jgi:hypothetical protein